MDKAYSTHGKYEKCVQIFVRKSEKGEMSAKA